MIRLYEKIDTSKTYGETLVRLGEMNRDIVVVEADLMKASGSLAFKSKFPARHFDVGIAEQDLVSFAAGLAAMGKIPFASSFACFISQRACDQAVNSVAYNKFNVKLVGTYAGLTSEKNGGTHISVEDLAIFRSMPGMQVFDPGDAIEFRSILEYAAKTDEPMYIRSNKGNFESFHTCEFKYNPNTNEVLNEGSDIGLISTGIATLQAIKACEILEKDGISVRLVHCSRIKPFAPKEIIETARLTNKIVTVENHSIYGGLGSAVAEILCEEYPCKLSRMGMQDSFGETACLEYLLKRFEIDSDSIVKKIRGMIQK